MGEYNNRYYGGMNKESQIRSNSFHTHTNAHHISVDTKKLEEQETLSSASSTAAQTASTAATTTTTAAASSSAAVGSSAAVAGGTAAAVATATAVVVASAIFNENVMGVDTHIFRVLNRIGLTNSKTPEKTGEEFSKKYPKYLNHDSHFRLVLFGRYNCTARSPKCDGCELKTFCKYYKEGKKNVYR